MGYQVASYPILVILKNYLVSAIKDNLNPQFCSVSPVNLSASVFQRFDTELIHERMSVPRQDGLLLSSVLPKSEETGVGTFNCQLKSEEG